MKVLMCHNYYQQPGGEDQSFAAEAHLLESYGHQVVRYMLHNDAIKEMSCWEAARRTFWNRQTYGDLRALIRRERPLLMHCTNIFPLISPAAYYAARDEEIPVLQSLRNYRLLCVGALLHRDGHVCEDCLNKNLPWRGVWHACYRQNLAASAVVAAMQCMHRTIKTWTRAVSLYVALTDRARQKFIAGGLPAEKIAVKPNFIPSDTGPGSGQGGYAVFVGRLSAEKGINTLLQAWSQLGNDVPLKIIGDGPLADEVQAAAQATPGIEWLGRRSPEEVSWLVGEAECLVMPSVWYEMFPRVILDAFVKGTPAVASRLGAMAEVVDDGRTGRHFEPGDAQDLVKKVRETLADTSRLTQMRRAARAEFEAKYTAEINYQITMSLYRRVVHGESSTQDLPRIIRRRAKKTFGVLTTNVNRANAPF